jgi:hypothetical protein
MSHAVISRFTDADEIDDLPRATKGVMPGAEGGSTPDHERNLEFVARERAVLAWGRLRGISVLDSAQAEKILAAAILEAVAASRGPVLEQQRQADAVKKAARALRSCVQKLWGDLGADRDPSRGSVKQCRMCGGSRLGHKDDCPVRKALKLALDAGLGMED